MNNLDCFPEQFIFVHNIFFRSFELMCSSLSFVFVFTKLIVRSIWNSIMKPRLSRIFIVFLSLKFINFLLCWSSCEIIFFEVNFIIIMSKKTFFAKLCCCSNTAWGPSLTLVFRTIFSERTHNWFENSSVSFLFSLLSSLFCIIIFKIINSFFKLCLSLFNFV